MLQTRGSVVINDRIKSQQNDFLYPSQKHRGDTNILLHSLMACLGGSDSPLPVELNTALDSAGVGQCVLARLAGLFI